MSNQKVSSCQRGGIGIVLIGWIDQQTLTASTPASGVAVAVKWNHGGLKDHHKWLEEIEYLGQLHHPNLVKLIGYCLEQENMISVREFMCKGSLDMLTRLYLSFPWAMRIKVAVCAARGLSFLHGLEIPVIHRDFNTTNILLDGELNAKLSNFSLATDGPAGDKTRISTQDMDTYGYAAPEYMATGNLTTRCNVYSFGVVLLELLLGGRGLDKNPATGEPNLVEWAKPYLDDKRKLSWIMDTRLYGQYPHNGAYKV